MAEEKNQQDQVEEQGQEEEQEAPLVVAVETDAANTVTQPTSYKLAPGQQSIGGVPDDRFTEEVVKGSDEDSGDGWETHPEENQPVKGIAEGDELPDTTGRAALREQKK